MAVKPGRRFHAGAGQLGVAEHAIDWAGAQIGVAVSDDGVHFDRLFDEPFLPNGPPGSWNSSESGHPFLFQDDDGRDYLFYQGNNDKGKTWFLSKMNLHFDGPLPYLVRPRDGQEFRLADPRLPE